jgi:Bacterial PH domain
MASGQESVFWYMVPSPDTRLVQRALAYAVLTFTVGLAWIWLLGLVPLSIAVAVCVVYVAVVIGTVFLTSSVFKRSHVVVAPTGLVFKRWFDKREVAWQDVVSVGLGKREPANFAEKLLRGESDTPCEKIVLSRPRPGLTVPGSNMIAPYLQDGERFVQDAQQYLTPAPG